MIDRMTVSSLRPWVGNWLRADREQMVLGCLFVLSLVQILPLLRVSPTIIRGDGVGYYVYLRSLFFDHDLGFRNEYTYFASVFPDTQQPMTTMFLNGAATPTGLVHNPWPVGPAILWTPFFLLGHLLALVSSVPVDGYSLPYQLAIALGSASYAFAGLLLIYRVCRDYFTPAISGLSVLLIWFATSLTAYMYFMPSMSHACSLFAVSLFIYLWHRSRGNRSLIMWAALGAAAGLMTLQRYQDALFGLFVVFEVVGILFAAPALHRWKAVKELALPLIVFTVSGAILSLPQLATWQVVYGRPLLNVQYESAGYTFDWWNPRLLDVLFSSNHGLLSWTPVVTFGLIGLVFLWKRDRMLTLALAGVFLTQLYVIASWEVWTQGAAFGGRMFVSCGMAFAVGLAALLDQVQGRVRTWHVSLVGGLFIAWNYVLLFQYGIGMIPREGAVSWIEVFHNTLKLFALLTIPIRSLLS
jgi:hypothetical protein